MTEAKLKSVLVKKLREAMPNAVIFRIEDRLTHGIPDICIFAGGMSSFIEVKYGNPSYKVTGIQELTIKRLDREGMFAAFLIYQEKDGIKTTRMEKPSGLWAEKEGFDHDWVVDLLKNIVHGF